MATYQLPDGRTLNVPDDLDRETLLELAPAALREYGIDITKPQDRFSLPELFKAVGLGAARTMLDIPKGYVAPFDLGDDDEAMQGLVELQRYLSQDTTLAPNPIYQDRFWHKAATGFGSLLPYVGGGFLRGALMRKGRTGLAKAILPAIAAPHGVSGAAEFVERSRMMGTEVSNFQETMAEILGIPIGLSEILTINRMFRGIPKTAARYGPTAATIRRVVTTGGVEALQETGAGIAQGLVARGVYDSEIPITESMVDDFTVGGVVGAMADLMVNSIGGRRGIARPYMYEAEANLRDERENLKSLYGQAKRARSKLFSDALKSGDLNILEQEGEQALKPVIPLPPDIMPPPQLEVIENTNNTFSVIDLANPENPVIGTQSTETDALIFRDNVVRDYKADLIDQIVNNDLYNLGLINSSTAKEIATTIISGYANQINAKVLSLYDSKISEVRRQQIAEEKKAEEEYLERTQGYGGWLYRQEAREQLEQARLDLPPIIRKRPAKSTSMVERLQNKAERKKLERKEFYTFAEAKQILEPKDFTQLVTELSSVVFNASEKMGNPSIVADKITPKVTPKYIKEIADSKNIDLDFKDDSVKYAAEQWTGTKSFSKMSNAQKQLFLARLHSLPSFNQTTKFPDFSPRNYNAQDTANFVANVGIDAEFTDADVALAVGKENVSRFVNDLLYSGRAERISPKKYTLVDNFEFAIARRAEGFNETPEEFGKRLLDEGVLTEDMVAQLVEKETTRQKGFLPPTEVRSKIINYGEVVREGRTNKFAKEAKRMLRQAGLNETGVIISDQLLSTRNLKEIDGKIYYDPSRTEKTVGEGMVARAEYDPYIDTIFLSLDNINPTGKMSDVELEEAVANDLNEEIIHALREKDLFKEKEYNFLRRFSKRKNVPAEYSEVYKNRTYYEKAASEYGRTQFAKQLGRSEQELEELYVEEAIADMYKSRTYDGINFPPKADKLMGKITNFYKAMGIAMRSVGYRRAKNLFEDIESGKIGARSRNEIRTLKLMDMKREVGWIPTFSVATIHEDPVVEGIQAIDMFTGRDKLPNISTLTDLAKALEKRTREANNGKSLVNRNEKGSVVSLSEENIETISEILAVEAVYGLARKGNASNWYKNELQTAMSLASLVFPNIATDPSQETILKAILAITSNGIALSQNSDYAVNVYQNYIDTGTVFGEGVGTSKIAMGNSLTILNQLMQAVGVDETVRFLNKDYSRRELDEAFSHIADASRIITLERVDAQVKGSAIFGPKIGSGFLQNMMGNYDALTPDRWFMRTWGRVTGTLTSANYKRLNTALKKFRAEMNKNVGLARRMGFPIDTIRKNDDVAIDVANKIYAQFARNNFADKNRLNSTARSVNTATQELRAPKSATEMENLRVVMNRVVEKLRARGYPNIDVASEQATAWFLEKELYKQYLPNTQSEVTDYAEQFERIARERGVSESAIAGAIAERQQRSTASVERNAPRIESGATEAVSPEDRAVTEGIIDIPKFSISERKKAEKKGFDTTTVYYHGGVGWEVGEAEDADVFYFLGDNIASSANIDSTFLTSGELSIVDDPFVAYQYAYQRGSDINERLVARLAMQLDQEKRTGATMLDSVPPANLRHKLITKGIPFTYLYPMYLKKDIRIFDPTSETDLYSLQIQLLNEGARDIWEGWITTAVAEMHNDRTFTRSEAEELTYDQKVEEFAEGVIKNSGWATMETEELSEIFLELGYDGFLSKEDYGAWKGATPWAEGMESNRAFPQIRLFNPEEDAFVNKDLVIRVPPPNLARLTEGSYLKGNDSPFSSLSPFAGGKLTKAQQTALQENYIGLNTFSEALRKANFIEINKEVLGTEYLPTEARKDLSGFLERELRPNITREGRSRAIEEKIKRNWLNFLEQKVLEYYEHRPNPINPQAEQGVIRDENIQASRKNKGKVEAARAGGFTDIIRRRTGRTYDQTTALTRRKNTLLRSDEKNLPLRVATLYNQKYSKPSYTRKREETKPELQRLIANNFERLAIETEKRIERVRTSYGRLPLHAVSIKHALKMENEVTFMIMDSYQDNYPNLLKDHNIRSYGDLVIKAYDQMIKETEQQYQDLLDTGIVLEYHDGAGQYADANEMQSDVHLFSHLWVYRGGEPHPLLSEVDEKGLSLNDKFRAVHDYFGHAVNGNGFGVNGEETAFASHAQMYSPLAALAVATETRGQNSYVNYGKREQVNVDVKFLQGIAARSMKLYEDTGDPLWLVYANNLSDTVGENYRYPPQAPLILDAELLADVIPDNTGINRVSDARRRAIELTEDTPVGDIPYYNVNASDDALQSAMDFNEDLTKKAPEDIPKFSVAAIPEGFVDAIDVIGKPDKPQKSWGMRMLDVMQDPVTNISRSFEQIKNSLVDAANIAERKALERAEDNEEVRSLLNKAATGSIQAIRMADRATGVMQRALLKGYPTKMIEGTEGLTKIMELVDENGNFVGGPIYFLAPLFNDPTVDKEAIFKLIGVAERAIWLNDKGIETPVNELVLERAEEAKRLYPEVLQAWKHYQLWNGKLLDYAASTGLVSEEQAKLWKEHAFYYPYYRKMEDESVVGPNIASGMLANNPLAIKMRGSDKQINLNPLEAISRNSLALITAAMKNDGVAKYMNEMEIYGSAVELLGAQRKNMSALDTITVFKDGQKAYYRIDDPETFNALKALDISPMKVPAIFSGSSRLLRDMITRDPGFIAVNMLRDTLSAYVTSGSSYVPILDTIKGFMGDISELEDFGVIGGYDFANDDMDIVTYIRKKMKDEGLSPDNAMTAGDAFIKLWDGLGGLTTKSDGATRQAVYVDVYNRMKEKGYSEAVAQSEGAFQALEIINFGRHGSSPVFRAITASIPFLNARVQGLDVLWRAGTGQYSAFDRLSKDENYKDVQKRIMTRMWMRGGLMFISTLLYYLLVSDSEEYRNAKREKRDDNWLVRTPFGNFWLPIPFEVGIMFKVVPERLLDALSAEPVEKYPLSKSARRQLKTSLNVPIFQKGLGIQLLKPLHEALANESDYTGSEIVPYHMLSLEPELQYRESTNELAKSLGRFLNRSPMKIEHVINGYTGTLGGYLLRLTDYVARRATGAPLLPMRIDKLPVIKRFYQETGTGGGLQQQFYELGREVDRMVSTINALKRQNRFDELATYRKNNMGLLRVQYQVRAIEKYLKYWRTRRDRLIQRMDISPVAKNILMNDLVSERDDRLAFVPALQKRAREENLAR